MLAREKGFEEIGQLRRRPCVANFIVDARDAFFIVHIGFLHKLVFCVYFHIFESMEFAGGVFSLIIGSLT